LGVNSGNYSELVYCFEYYTPLDIPHYVAHREDVA